MSIKVRIETDPSAEEEVIIRCHECTPGIRRLYEQITSGDPEKDILLTLGGREYVIALQDILFFAADGDRTAAHTADGMYYTDRTLTELSAHLPGYFSRGSKSCLLNVLRVSSLQRELTGVCEVCFSGSSKKVYVSRMYYKPFRERLTELRLNPPKNIHPG